MSKEELTVIINQVQNTLLKYLITTAIPLIVSGTVGVMVIRGDIGKNATISHSENVNLKHYVDSLHHDDQVYNQGQFTDIRNQLLNLPQSKTTIIRQTLPNRGVNSTLYNMRYIDGKLSFIPVK